MPPRRIPSDRLLLRCWEPGDAPLLDRALKISWSELQKAGLYRRVGPRALEIGYWVRTDLEGRGIATEAAALLTHAGLGLPGIDRMEIRCDPDHTASAAVPRKLGYHLREVLRQEASESSSAERDTMVFEMSARQFRALAASGAYELKGRSRRTSHRREREGEGP
jgi:RimJ/RimL family protein N-acetyltransferase